MKKGVSCYFHRAYETCEIIVYATRKPQKCRHAILFPRFLPPLIQHFPSGKKKRADYLAKFQSSKSSRERITTLRLSCYFSRNFSQILPSCFESFYKLSFKLASPRIIRESLIKLNSTIFLIHPQKEDSCIVRSNCTLPPISFEPKEHRRRGKHESTTFQPRDWFPMSGKIACYVFITTEEGIETRKRFVIPDINRGIAEELRERERDQLARPA